MNNQEILEDNPSPQSEHSKAKRLRLLAYRLICTPEETESSVYIDHTSGGEKIQNRVDLLFPTHDELMSSKLVNKNFKHLYKDLFL